MKIFIDSADVSAIQDCFTTGLVDGVTTNPTLIRKSGRHPHDVYNELKLLGVKDISMEVSGTGLEMAGQQINDAITALFHTLLGPKILVSRPHGGVRLLLRKRMHVPLVYTLMKPKFVGSDLPVHVPPHLSLECFHGGRFLIFPYFRNVPLISRWFCTGVVS